MNHAQSDYAGFWVGSDGSTFYVTSDSSYNSPGSITIGSWHHIYVANRNGSGSGGFRLASSTTYSTDTCTGMTVGSGLPFIINNADGGFNSAEFFDGYFAHVKVWSGNGNLPTDAQDRW